MLLAADGKLHAADGFCFVGKLNDVVCFLRSSLLANGYTLPWEWARLLLDASLVDCLLYCCLAPVRNTVPCVVFVCLLIIGSLLLDKGYHLAKDRVMAAVDECRHVRAAEAARGDGAEEASLSHGSCAGKK